MQKSPTFPLALTISGVALIGFAFFARSTPLIVWNASASVPTGFYRLASGKPEYGDFVLVRTPESVAALAAAWGYLPLGIPLIKHIAAVIGDDVCVIGRDVFINGNEAAFQLETDRAGRHLPRWKGCRKLVSGEYFLLTEASDSFDSRYFGPVDNQHIIGRLAPLWTK